ncbi:uncharacterized protein LOC128442876 isoform X3 [Pleuronectes platessa]|uniref:uncharacterized protein LOC128442876 isoform X3 n=1 Tax=Pleuronectes platessa TaxID=8262 RepID=UPI00232A3162|nr:uncharacterized protein LOC128442876 isoform X3 [Pleuronectes platessa]
MPMLAFFIELLLVHYTTQSSAGIQAVCGGDVSLPCRYEDIESINFISVTWYKLNNQSRNGIILRKKRENRTTAFTSARASDFGDKYSLMLRNVTPEDSGNYDCYIAANIGGTNRNSYVYLTVQDCVTPTTSSPPPNAQVIGVITSRRSKQRERSGFL